MCPEYCVETTTQNMEDIHLRWRILIDLKEKKIWNSTETLYNTLETFHWLMVLGLKTGNLVKRVDAFWMNSTAIVYLGKLSQCSAGIETIGPNV